MVSVLIFYIIVTTLIYLFSILFFLIGNTVLSKKIVNKNFPNISVIIAIKNGINSIENIINDLKKSTCAVLLVTHSLDQAVNLGDRVAILSNGKVGYDQATELVDIKKLTEKYFEYSDQFKKVKT